MGPRDTNKQKFFIFVGKQKIWDFRTPPLEKLPFFQHFPLIFHFYKIYDIV